MANSFRHFGALFRKNFIVWYRTPGCGVLEILAPVIVMVMLAWVRSKIPTTMVDQDGMIQKQYVSFPGVPRDPTIGYWANSDAGDYLNNEFVKYMFDYTGYHSSNDPDPINY